MASGGTMAMLNTSMDPNPQIKLPDSGKDSVRSTKSLSIFVNPDTPKEMARSEEVTISMYSESPDVPSATVSPGRGKRRHRDNADQTEAKENRKSESTSTSRMGFFNFMKKKKTPETKGSSSLPTATESTSKSTSNSKSQKRGTDTELENSINLRTELELSRSDADDVVAESSFQSSSANVEQVKTGTTVKSVKTVELKSGTGAQQSAGADQQAAANSTTSTTITAGFSTSSGNAATSTSSSADKSAENLEWRKRVGRQQNDEKKELVVHSLPTYSPADVDLRSSAVRDKNVIAKFEALLGGQENGGSGLSSPGSAIQLRKTHLPREDQNSTSALGSEVGSATNTLTRHGRQSAQGEEFVSPAAIERMAEMQSMLKAGQVPKVIRQMSSESAPVPAERVRSSVTENREYYARDSSADELSLQEDMVFQATEYYGQNLLTPTAVGQQGRTSSGEDRNTTPTPATVPAVQENKDVGIKVSTVQSSHLEGSSSHPVDSSKTVQKSGGEVQKPQPVLHTTTRSQEQRSATITVKSSSAAKEQPERSDQIDQQNSDTDVKQRHQRRRAEDKLDVTLMYSTEIDSAAREQRSVVPKVSSAQTVQTKTPYSLDKHDLSKDLSKMSDQATRSRSEQYYSAMTNVKTVSTTKKQKKTPDQVDLSESDRDVKKEHRTVKAEFNPYVTLTSGAEHDTQQQQQQQQQQPQQHEVEAKLLTDVVRSVHAVRSNSPHTGRKETDLSSHSSDSEIERHTKKTKTELEEDRDSTPTPTTTRKLSEQEIASQARSAKIQVISRRSTSPGAHGVETGTTERLYQKTSDKSDEAESASDVEQRQHTLKAQTQAELLEQAKRRYTTANAASGDHNVKTASKSTYTVTMSTHTSKSGGDAVERVPSKASIDRREEEDRSKYQVDERQRKTDISSGRPGRVEVNHQEQPEVNGYRDGSTNMASEDFRDLRPHMRPREHRVPVRTQSNASSDISSSVASSTDREFHQAVESNARHLERRGSNSSSDATPTEADVHLYRGRKAVPTSREPMRRSTSLPMSDEVDAEAGDPAVMDFTGGQRYNVAPLFEARQPTAVLYAGRTTTPVSGRQKLKRTTQASENDDETDIRSERMYLDHGSDRQVSNAGMYERARRHRQSPSSRTRPGLNHNVDGELSTSPDDTHISSQHPYAPGRPPVMNGDVEYDVDVADRRPTQRQAPTGRTGRISRSGEVDIRVMNSSPERARTPASTDDRHYQLRQNIPANAGYARRAPGGRSGHIHHDISVSPSNANTRDGLGTPASTTDWLRHQRSNQLTVDVAENATNLNRAYRSMPDLMNDYKNPEEAAPSRNLHNYPPDHYGDDILDKAEHQRPRSTNPGSYSGGRVTATIRDRMTEPPYRAQVNGHYRPRYYSSSETGGGPSGGRKRGFITGAAVENRVNRGRRSGRTDDMPLTDVEDVYDSWGKPSGEGRRHRPSYVARIRVGGDDDDVGWDDSPDDVQSVFSEPPHMGRLRSINTPQPRPVTTHSQSRPFALLTPAYVPPISVPQGAFELAHVDTQIHHPMSPDLPSPEATIAAVDPALRGASKQGTNYHITLTLKPTITTSSLRQGTVMSRSQLMTSSQMMMTSQGDTYAGLWSQPPRPVSSMAVYSTDNPSAGWPTSQPHDRPPPRRPTTLPTRPTGRETPTARPRSRSRSATRSVDGQIGFDVEVRSVSDDDQGVRTSLTQHQVNATSYELGPQISSSVEFTYSPPSHENLKDPMDPRGRHQPVEAPPPRQGRRQRPQQNAEDWVTRSYNRTNQQQVQQLPENQRKAFLVKKTIDTSKPPKVHATLNI